MPELPEVERARKLIADSCTDFKIKSVDVTEDKIVYAGGITHEDYVTELTGRTITGCERKGKIFWMTLSGAGRLPVMHFGMNGMVQIKGQEPTWYVRRPRERPKEWPPKYYKFAMELEGPSGSSENVQLAFLDSRRLARLRLVPQPVASHPPVSALGFDPVLNMPNFDDFLGLLKRKKGTVKGVIMDQAFSAGVGNWVADEILYQARIHPACPVPALSEDDLKRLHHWIRVIPETAVAVNAMHGKFPEDWLFRWRWGKGKKQERRVKKAQDDGRVKVEKVEETVIKTEDMGTEAEDAGTDSASEGEDDGSIQPKGREFMALPNGKPATITFIEVGGRTTAVVTELQKMPEGVEIKPKISKGGKGSRSKKGKGDDGDDSAGGSTSRASSPLSPDVEDAAEVIDTPSTGPSGQKRVRGKRTKNEPLDQAAAEEAAQKKSTRKPSKKARRGEGIEVKRENTDSSAHKPPASKRPRKSDRAPPSPPSAATGKRKSKPPAAAPPPSADTSERIPSSKTGLKRSPGRPARGGSRKRARAEGGRIERSARASGSSGLSEPPAS